MTPTGRAAIVLAGIALLALILPIGIVLALAAGLVAAIVIDVRAVRHRPELSVDRPTILSRGSPAAFTISVTEMWPSLRLLQPQIPEVSVTPREGGARLRGELIGRHRGRYALPAPAGRAEGPLGLACRHYRWDEDAEVIVYPDMVGARFIVTALRRGRFGETGRSSRGPLGLGTDFESIRDYLPDDDVRQVNWRATARLGRPMSNQYRIEQDRDVVCVVDTGRLMTAPLIDRNRLDEALDAVTAVALVADELGDRCGGIAFDSKIRRSLSPRRAGARSLVHALFDLEASSDDSDYELAFRSIEGAKRALVIVLTDLIDQSAARSLLDAVPVIARRHAVVVASATDPDLVAAVETPPEAEADVYRATVALDMLEARRVVAGRLRGFGADVVEAPPGRLPAACVSAYLRAKSRARL